MPYHSQTKKSFSSIVIILSISITFVLLLLNKVNSAETVSFEFTKFHRQQQNFNLLLQSDANITDAGYISLTEERYEEGQLYPVFHSLGRVLYPIPIHIWDGEKDTIASFETEFSFSIVYYDIDKTAEGLAFFLAPVDFDPQHSTGGLLGVFSSTPSLQSAKESILAVEFDTFFDPWDPPGPHYGIDIKSIKSRKTMPWILHENSTAIVSIKYDAPSFTLTVSLVYGHIVFPPLTQEVDLMDVLPPWVTIGISATTGDKRDITETHRLHSWSFSSTLPDTSDTLKGFKKTNITSSVVEA